MFVDRSNRRVKRLLFLFPELADYSVACFNAVKRADPAIEILVVHYPVNAEAPFSFSFDGSIKYSCISAYRDYKSLKRILDEYGPEKIVCAGWMNKWYVRYCTFKRRRAVCIITMDNIWTGSLKQRLFSALSFLLLRRTFDFIWVPGERQVRYARRLGYKDDRILKSLYSCDTDKFRQISKQFEIEKRSRFPHRFVCVARYVPQKGYQLLWEAFIEWKRNNENDWELWCAGTGEGFEKRIFHPQIKHLGFVDKDRWKLILAETGVFVLPSIHEPWGVVVHEFAAAQYPLLISRNVGSTEAFLSAENGFSFDPENKKQLIRQFDKISKMSDAQLFDMGQKSEHLAMQITPEVWAQTLMSA